MMDLLNLYFQGKLKKKIKNERNIVRVILINDDVMINF